MNRLRLPVVVIALSAIVLAGCGDDEGSGGSSGTKDAEKVGQARAQGDVTWCIGKDTSGAFKIVVDNFNKANPNANVELLELPESADEQRRLQIQRLRAKSPQCDVLGMDVIWTAEYAAQGWLLDVSDSLEQRKGDFIPSTLDTALYEDKYWAYPFTPTPASSTGAPTRLATSRPRAGRTCTPRPSRTTASSTRAHAMRA